MRLIASVLLCGFLAQAAVSPQLAQVQKVYLFPMTNGMDQYLANRITNASLFQVVTDPKAADAVFTDRIGPVFEAKLEEVRPQPAPPEPEPAAKKEEKEKKDEDEDSGPASPELHADQTPRVSSFGRGKGTVFLVDVNTREVIWSVYAPPRSSMAPDLDRAAQKIAGELRKTLKRK